MLLLLNFFYYSQRRYIMYFPTAIIVAKQVNSNKDLGRSHKVQFIKLHNK
jgi:hypothetical protein